MKNTSKHLALGCASVAIVGVTAALTLGSGATAQPTSREAVEAVFASALTGEAPADSVTGVALSARTGGRLTDSSTEHAVISAETASVSIGDSQTCLTLVGRYGPGTSCARNDALTTGRRPLWQSIGYGDTSTLLVLAPTGGKSVDVPGTPQAELNKQGAALIELKGELSAFTVNFTDGSKETTRVK